MQLNIARKEKKMRRIALIFASSFGFSKNPADNSLDIFLSSKGREVFDKPI